MLLIICGPTAAAAAAEDSDSDDVSQGETLKKITKICKAKGVKRNGNWSWYHKLRCVDRRTGSAALSTKQREPHSQKDAQDANAWREFKHKENLPHTQRLATVVALAPGALL